MQFMLAQPIARKLPALIVSLCLAACLSIAVVGYFDFVRIIRQETAKNLAVITSFFLYFEVSIEHV